MFLLIKRTTILLQRFARQAPWPSPYLDTFGEHDFEMNRGKPIFENEEPYAAAKAREYLDKPAIHETMVKVSAYLLGEFGHLLGRRPGCSPKELFNIIHEKLPTVSIAIISILLSTYAKILMHYQPPDLELQNQIWIIFKQYESSIEVEIQQRAIEYFALSRKGATLMYILAEMPKFPERQSALIKKVEDTEVDTAETSAIKLRAQ